MHKILLKFPFIALIIFSLDATSQALNEANAYLDSLPESIRADVNREMERTAYEDGKEVFFSKIPSEIEKKLINEIEDLKEIDKFNERYGESFFRNFQSSFMPVNEPNFDGTYIIDYGDILNIQMIGSLSQELSVPVLRDGTVSIPDVGKFNVSGLSLSKVADLLVTNIALALTGTKTFVTLSEVRDVDVLIVGEVDYPGLYTLSGGSNILQALNAVGGPNKDGSFRDITIIRNGKNINIDLYKFLITNKAITNFRLRSGDTIKVNPTMNLVRASGGFNRPNLYELKPNETLFDLLSYANGMSHHSEQVSILLDTYKDGSYKSLPLNYEELKTTTPKYGDNLYIEFRKYKNVFIDGGVKRPGFYEVSDNDKLSSLIIRAGGYTENAYVFGAALYRESAKELEKLNNEKIYNDLIKFLASSIANPSSGGGESLSAVLPLIMEEFKNTEPLGRIQAEFDLLDIKTAPNKDTLLKDRDKIFIPEYDNQVYVFGEALNPGSFRFNSTSTINDYISYAGGLSRYAHESTIIIVHPDGKAEITNNSFIKKLSHNSISVYPGSVIFIPRDIGKVTGLNYGAVVAPIVSSLAISIASLSAINNNK